MLIQCLFQLINGNEHELHTSFKNVPKRNMQMKTQIQNNDMFKLVILYDDTFFFYFSFKHGNFPTKVLQTLQFLTLSKQDRNANSANDSLSRIVNRPSALSATKACNFIAFFVSFELNGCKLQVQRSMQ